MRAILIMSNSWSLAKKPFLDTDIFIITMCLTLLLWGKIVWLGYNKAPLTLLRIYFLDHCHSSEGPSTLDRV